jgi:dUTP pyrophosphatase
MDIKMQKVTIPIKQLENHDFELPHYATEHSAGMDLSAAIEDKIIIEPGAVQIIPTGIAIALPDGFEAQVRPRSGLAAKFGVTVLNSPGTIDADYRGEIKAILINHGKSDFVVEKGMRIAQLVIAKYEQIKWDLSEDLSETARGIKGFGSTGH